MPAGAYRECRAPRCLNYAVANGLCREHQRIDVADDKRLQPNNRTFIRLRRSFLVRHPLCARCNAPATVLDHIVPHRGRSALFWDQTNWQSLCFRCHGIKTHAELLADR